MPSVLGGLASVPAIGQSIAWALPFSPEALPVCFSRNCSSGALIQVSCSSTFLQLDKPWLRPPKSWRSGQA